MGAGALGALIGGLALAAVVALRGGSDARVTYPPLDQMPDLTITVSPGLLAALIDRSVRQGESPVPLENARVETAAGMLTIRGDIPVLGRGVGVSVELEPEIRDGEVKMVIRRARLGAVPIPSNLADLAERPINDRIAAATGGLPATITAVRVAADGVTVTARVRVAELPTLPR